VQIKGTVAARIALTVLISYGVLTGFWSNDIPGARRLDHTARTWKGSTMSNTGGQPARSVRPAVYKAPEQNHAIVLKRIFESSADELVWIAELMSGSRQTAEQCIAEAVDFAETAQYVGPEWILPWVKRLLVQVALKSIRAEIRDWLPSPNSRLPAKLVKLGLSESERRKVRAISPQEIIASCDALERACFVLSAYLRYSLLDCALLLGVPRDWIEPICERAFMKILDVPLSAKNQLGEIDSFVSPGAMGCQAD
jgi:DNA-directed RNA polymerase specialized sigma24 family protein